MGHGFGHLYRGLRIITISLSPFEQRAYAGALTKGIPRTLQRSTELIYILPPFILGYLLHLAVESAHKKKMRKKPGEFDNDE